MNKTELVDAVARNTGHTKSAAAVIVNETLSVIVDAVAGGRHVQLSGFGRFEARDRKARTARNLRTGAQISVPETRIPAFKAGKAFKEAVKPG
jgi:DNA-binding protein HU-beta